MCVFSHSVKAFLHTHYHQKMDILLPHKKLLATAVSCSDIAVVLASEKLISWNQLLHIDSSSDTKVKTDRLMDTVKEMDNPRATARLFEIIKRDYPWIASLIPGLISGHRYEKRLVIGLSTFVRVICQ